MKSINKITLIAIAILIHCVSIGHAQEEVKPLTSEERQIAIDSIGNKLTANYVFPEIAKNMASHISVKMTKGDYQHITDPQELASALTKDLQDISKDKHIRVSFAPRSMVEQQHVSAEDSLAFLNQYINDMKRNNFGFKEVKIMPGNIGYLDLRSFSNVEYAGETAVSAMNFLSNADAIIIDLRNNRGGSPAMIQLISSYLFDSNPVHLNNFYWRPTGQRTQTWTLPHVSGKRNTDSYVYVLTSGSTFSAAEEFSYNLKHLGRATLVGETTGGGAHPGGDVRATDRFLVWVPTGRAINPITETNWEGTGVIPHIKTSNEDALHTAYTDALTVLKEDAEDKRLKAYYEWPLAKLRLKDDPISLDSKQLKAFAGHYGPRHIFLENGKLCYQRDSGRIYPLIPYSKNEFILDGLDRFRIRFLSEGKKIVALQGLYDNGNTDKNLRTAD